MKLIYDDLLDEYLDEDGNIVKGQPVAEKVSFGKYFGVLLRLHDVSKVKFLAFSIAFSKAPPS